MIRILIVLARCWLSARRTSRRGHPAKSACFDFPGAVSVPGW